MAESDVAIGTAATSKRSASANWIRSRFAAPMPKVTKRTGGQTQAADVRKVQGGAVVELDRSFVAQHLFDGGRQKRRLDSEASHLAPDSR